jgi:hypothetical protein
MKSDFNPGGLAKPLSWVLLLVGVLSTIAGLSGVWLQGFFYRDGFPVAATFGEVRFAFTGPTAVTVFGCLLVCGVVLASPLTERWPRPRKLAVFVSFSAVVLLACLVCGHFAAVRVQSILR